jgi:hypothetical protein
MKATQGYIDSLLIQRPLLKMNLPQLGTRWAEQPCLFATRGAVVEDQDQDSEEKRQNVLVLVIQGNGSFRAGAWDLQVCLNDGLFVGSQLSYIDLIISRRWDLILLNPNQPHTFRGPCSGRAVRNVSFCWEKYIERENRFSQIYIIAHGTGAQAAVDLLEEYETARDLVKKVVFLNGVFRSPSDDVATILSERGRNWVPSPLPLDDVPHYHPVKLVMPCFSSSCPDHAMMCAACVESVFRYLDEKRRNARDEEESQKPS